MTTAPLAITCHFRRLRDPRRNHRKRHRLLDIIVTALCAVIAGANDWQQIATFAAQRREWLQTFLDLPNGTPSHDTFERVFIRLNPQAFLGCFQQWIKALTAGLGLNHVAIDGKTLRHSGNARLDFGPLHLVSAWATACHLSLGQVAVADKSNEITAIPQLLELLEIKGALVTIDAMGCQKAIAKKIIAEGADYILAVKDNQPTLLEDIQKTIGTALDSGPEGVAYDICSTDEKGHGRKETRTYVIVTNLEQLRTRQEWAELNVVGMCTRTRVVDGAESTESHYFIGSRLASVKVYAHAVRQHWGIENSLHWQLDVAFAEDANRVSQRHGAENLALVRRLALSLLKRHPSKLSIPCKRLTAALNTTFLEEILCGGRKLGKV